MLQRVCIFCGSSTGARPEYRAAAEEVRQAQSSWSRIGPVPDDVRRELSDRFARACRVITEKAGQAVKTGAPGTAGAPPKAGGLRR